MYARGVEIVKISTCPGTSKKPKCTCPSKILLLNFLLIYLRNFRKKVPTKTNDISFFSTLEMNKVKKSLSGNLKTIFVRILVRKMFKLWSQLLLFSPFQCAL